MLQEVKLKTKKRKTESLRKAQHNKIENVADSVYLSLFMDGAGKCKLPSTPHSTGLNRIQHLTRNLETSADVFTQRLSWNLQTDLRPDKNPILTPIDM
jgi:hypothetical protein